ncbi:MAG: hypothetical protein AB1632_04320 [Nitrospirota bacterium]
MKRIFFLIMIVFSLIGCNQSKNKGIPAPRACGQDDIIGTWQLIQLQPHIPPQENDPDFWENQIWIFSKSGKTQKIKKQTPFTTEDIKNLSAKFADDSLMTSTYELHKDKAALVLKPQDSPFPYLFSCFYVTEDFFDASKKMHLKKGDILLDLRTNDGKKIILGHQLRKVR